MSTFHQRLRRVINPDLPLSARHIALICCLSKLSVLTWRGDRTDGSLSSFRRAQRKRLNQRFHFDEPTAAQTERIIKTAAFAQAEYNKLRHVEQILFRRRISQKMRGRRSMTKAEREDYALLWGKAINNLREKL